MVQEVASQEEFDSLLSEAAGDSDDSKLVVVDFTASWCGPCVQIAPKFQRLSEEYPNVVFIKVDVDKCPSIAKAYKVSAMPTFKFIKGKNNDLYDTVVGGDVTALTRNIIKYSASDAVPSETPEGSSTRGGCQIL
mmetsp:Transcript_16058/g.15464  ORF Transcript_16058/g.15464 Transcript_16058/m.15464 type:complete len:135 (-) Transcript_16058:240-644(-)|eukprot:CAMPEP_0197826044 /NCGR_PEP_ID=MMETSP1437-20131217/3055_1 /TAXON_ID=49252 ORGANISM="Eucampia antarctica, Strain CCMP1452" /NCGR_SAMPLE_ID=MMETSP1437 /ASSEMBLY_ACC=CAM_ASM_001096 /LENGTH=134 /DNA_ID=CAMNT_0043426299 /DNA_START=125 /DNA_END=529 /DNA_ORIENTATION=+